MVFAFLGLAYFQGAPGAKPPGPEVHTLQFCEENLTAQKTPLEPVIAPEDPEKIESEMGVARVLFDLTPEDPNKGYKTLTAKGDKIPTILKEIGRLRELTFRQVGEGTGKPFDVDSYDSYYDQLFAYDKKEKRIVGGYRIGRVDEILRAEGVNGLYLQTLFDMDLLIKRIYHAQTLELGRSFVIPEYQRKTLVFFSLWSGIGRFIAENPDYRHLIGPVSISASLQPTTRQLMVEFLENRFMSPLAALARPRNPTQFSPSAEIQNIVSRKTTPEELVADLQASEGGNDKFQWPPLFPLYIGLGGRFLGFNVDPDFADVIDGLAWVDLTKTPLKSLETYMGAEAAQKYLAHQLELERKKDPKPLVLEH